MMMVVVVVVAAVVILNLDIWSPCHAPPPPPSLVTGKLQHVTFPFRAKE